jgi:hypothetical protein
VRSERAKLLQPSGGLPILPAGEIQMPRPAAIATLLALLLSMPASAQTDRSIPGKSKPHDPATRSERVVEHTARGRDPEQRAMKPKSKPHDPPTRSERVKEHTARQREGSHRELVPKSKPHDPTSRSERVKEHEAAQRDKDARKIPSGR